MAKKAALTKKLPPMGKPKPTAKAADKPAPAPKKAHERKTKPSEADRLEKGKKLAASYLVQRDGMDEDTARMVVDTMDPEDVNTLITEANTGVLAQTPAAAPSAPAASGEKASGASVVPDPEEGAADPIDFLTVPALADDDTFTEIAVRCRDNAVLKNEAEKQYKADKKILDLVLAEAGIDKLQPVLCAGVRLVRYTGKSPRRLSDLKLLEKGVSIDIINACWEQGEYDDVRVTTPKVEG